MANIIFARPDHFYDSYQDYWRIVELSGFPIITIGDIDPDSDNVYIFSTPATHWHDGTERHGWPGARARIIYYNIEWYTDVDYKGIPGVEVWSADKWHADKIGAKYVLFGSHPDLPTAPLQDCPATFDYATLMYAWGRRDTALHHMREAGVRLTPNAWGQERHDLIQQSKGFVHVHQWDYAPTVAPQRFALAAAYRKPVVSELVADKGLMSEVQGLWCDYEYLPTFAKLWKDDNRLSDLGAALHYLLVEKYPFRRCIENAL